MSLLFYKKAKATGFLSVASLYWCSLSLFWRGTIWQETLKANPWF